jgi:Cyclin, N-terminal domain
MDLGVQDAAMIVSAFMIAHETLFDPPTPIKPCCTQDVTNANRNVNAGKSNRMHGAVEKKGASTHGSKLQIAVEPAQANSTMPRQNNVGKVDEPIIEDRNPTVAPRPVASMFQRPVNMAVNPSSYQYSGQVDNIDERDMDDPLCATEYVQDMYTLFRERETSTSVRPVYMENQTHINERMRSILVDWLVEVHLKFKLGRSHSDHLTASFNNFRTLLILYSLVPFLSRI